MISKHKNYNDSGIEWIKEYPTNWDLIKFKRLAKIKNGKDQKEVSIDEGGYPILGTGGEFGRSSQFIHDKPSVLLGRKGTINRPQFIEEPFWTVDTLFYTEIYNDVNPKFLFYLSQQIPFDLLQESSAVPSMTQEKLNSVYVVKPSKEEQTKIAQYLDHQTAIIAQLIQQKQKLIDLLKEKRQAVINEAVTKGLNPNAKMKDSGIEWLGEVPEKWKIKKLKFLVSLNSNEEVLIETSFKVALENIESGTGQFIESNSENQFEGTGNFFKAGDVLFNKLRPYLAKVFLATQNGYSVGELLVLTPKSEITSEFLFYRLLSQAFIEMVNGSTYGSKMPRAHWNFIGNLKIPFPAAKEQIEIVKFINIFQSNVNTLIAQSTIQIEKLKEYRQSLISEAVTGKIDVRDWHPIKNK
ncbi:MAG: restriction endonuclease subunit S [Saprospiraceae bacterium]|nr:restriction endonuclease subunit S [Saprospiraceae bacterium]